MVNVKETFTLVDPTTEAIVPAFEGAPRIPTIAGANIGLIDDSKRNADVLLEEIAAVLTEKYEVNSISWLKKPSASKPADPEIIREMVSKCDYVLVAIGS